MKKDYLTPKEIETIDIDAPLSKQEASDLCKKIENGLNKYDEKMGLVKDLPFVATLGLSAIGFCNTMINAFNSFYHTAPTAPNAALAAATLSASAGCLLLTAVTVKKCDKKLKNLFQVAMPKLKKLQDMTEQTEFAENEIQ